MQGTPELMDFYLYRAQGDDNYPPENINAADLAGVMWYLHNEVVPSTPRKFGVTRILRFRVSVKITDAYFYKYHKHFGPFVAFDSGACTAPNCNDIWNNFGFVVGCQNLDRNIANYVRYVPQDKPKVPAVLRKLSASNVSHGGHAHQRQESAAQGEGLMARSLLLIDNALRDRTRAHHDGAHHDETDRDDASTNTSTTTGVTTTSTTVTTTVTTFFMPVPAQDASPPGIWFSLPGACPESAVKDKTDECKARMPGGFCKAVTGGHDCTYNVEPAGEISLDEVSGILDPEADVKSYQDWWLRSYNDCIRAKSEGKHPGPCEHRIEYDVRSDKGVGCSFWDGKHSLENATRRMDHVRKLFRDKYPHLPDDHELPPPPCM